MTDPTPRRPSPTTTPAVASSPSPKQPSPPEHSPSAKHASAPTPLGRDGDRRGGTARRPADAATQHASGAPLIDFLPQAYRAQTQQARDRPLRRLAVLAALVLLGLGSVAHHRRTVQLTEQRDALASQQASSLQAGEADSLRARCTALDRRADLLATFAPTVSSSRLLAELTTALPRHAHLTSLLLRRDRPRRGAREAAEKTASPWEQDLADRLADREQEMVVLEIEGMTADDRGLGDLITALDEAGLFERIDIEFTEPAELRGLPRRRFRLRLTARPAGALLAGEPPAKS